MSHRPSRVPPAPPFLRPCRVGAILLAGLAWATAQAATGDGTWSGFGGLPEGCNGRIAKAARAPDGRIVVAGVFTACGGAVANRVAAFDPSTGAWSSLGSGLENGVNGIAQAIDIAGSDIYIGGDFTLAGTVPAARVARWNGSAWSSLGTGAANGVGGGPVQAIAVTAGVVYVAGDFNAAGGNPANRIARWNGSAWSTLGSGTSNGVGAGVRALAVDGGDLYAGGFFTTAGGNAANWVARWNGSAWSSLGSGSANGVNGFVNALLVTTPGVLLAAGNFNLAGGATANRVARWSGGAWSSLGTGAENGVGPGGTGSSLAQLGGEVLVGGTFTVAGTTTALRVARWNGSAFSALEIGRASCRERVLIEV